MDGAAQRTATPAPASGVIPCVLVPVAELQVLKQKRERFERAMDRASSFATFIGSAKDFLRAADIILTEHLPAAEPEKESV